MHHRLDTNSHLKLLVQYMIIHLYGLKSDIRGTFACLVLKDRSADGNSTVGDLVMAMGGPTPCLNVNRLNFEATPARPNAPARWND